jgi:diacylglycerol kinase (ATP)
MTIRGLNLKPEAQASRSPIFMAYTNAKGWRRLVQAFGYSMKGLKACYEFEEAFRQEVFILIPLVPIGLWLGETPVERAMLIGSLLLVPIVELLNSAIEANVDRIGLERHELSERAKDIASAAVFASVLFVFVVWSLILLPKWL